MYIIDYSKKKVEVHLTSTDKNRLYKALKPEVDSLIEGHRIRDAVLYGVVLGMFYAVNGTHGKV